VNDDPLATIRSRRRDLVALADWLAAQRITHVAMQATGIYWKPIWPILEGRFELAGERTAQLGSTRASPEIELSAQRAAR
jgi:hypothetical protein